MKRWVITVLSVILIVGVPLSAVEASDSGLSTESRALFRISETEALPVASSAAVIESRFINVNTRMLNSGEQAFELPTFGGATVEAVLSDFDQRALHQTTWRGWIGGEGQHRVILSLHEGYVAGVFYTDEGVYEILPTSGGHVVNLIDHQLADPCAEGSLSIPNFVAPPVVSEVPHDGGGSGSTNSTEANPEMVDPDAVYDIRVMAVYTPDARDAAGSAGAIEATVRAAVDTANTAFMDSDMDARYHLAHTEIAPDSYNDSGNIGSDLSWMDGSTNLHSMRLTHEADMVSLITENGGGYCGLAHVQRDLGVVTPYQVTARGCTVGNLSWAHEHGHNMGFEHDPVNGVPPGDALTTYAFAHFIDGEYRTVMSYSTECTLGCPRVAHFSNPDISHNGDVTGIADARDNARTGDVSDYTCANFVISQASGKRVAQYLGAERSWNDANFSTIKAAVENAGHVVTADGWMNGGILDGADILVVGEVTSTLTIDNRERIKKWVHEGGTLLMTNEGSTATAIQNEWLTAIGSSIRRGGSGSEIEPFPFVPDFIEGPPYNVATQTAANSTGSYFTGGIDLVGPQGKFEYLGSGGVVVLGDRLDHNIFNDSSPSYINTVNTRFFLNLIENGMQSTKHTAMLGGNGSQGNTFDIYNQTDTARLLNGFGVNMDGTAGDPTTVKVYYKVGTANGYETNASAWTKLGEDTTVTMAGEGELSRVKIGGLVLEPYTTYGFYIHNPSSDISYTNSSGSVYYNYGDLRLTTHMGMGSVFSTVHGPRQFNGTVFYTTVPWQTTHFNAGNGSAGNMFDVDVHDKEVKVEGFNVHLSQAGETGLIKVYYREGTCVGHTGSSTGWTYLGSDSVVSNGNGVPTPVNIGGVTLKPNTSYGFYVAVDDAGVVGMTYTDAPGPDLYTGPDISITGLYGKGAPLFTGSTFTYRTWNGTIFYSDTGFIFADGFESGDMSAWD